MLFVVIERMRQSGMGRSVCKVRWVEWGAGWARD